MEYPTKTQIMLSLKKHPGQTLDELSSDLKISKMAVLKHIQQLEGVGAIERRMSKGKMGRPFFTFFLRSGSESLLGESSDIMLDSLMEYLEESGNEKIATDFLYDRYGKTETKYSGKLSKYSGKRKIMELVSMRREENYYPELRQSGEGLYELTEYNCPIFKIANRFGIACELERSLFSRTLDMDVKSTHTQVNGHGVCKFLIRGHDGSK